MTVKSNTSIISQMTVIPKYQKTGIGSQLLNYLLNLAKNHKNISTIQLSARLTATTFYSKHHFIGVGEIYPSKKTGILHQLMVYSPLNK